MKHLYWLSAIGLLCMAGCKKEPESSPVTFSASERFDFETSDVTTVNLSASSVLAHATFELYSHDPEQGGKLYGKGMLDAQGNYAGKFRLPTHQQSIFLKSTYLGLPGDITIERSGAGMYYDFNAAQAELKSSGKSYKSASQKVGSTVYRYIGTYNNKGRPDYLVAPDAIDQSLLQDLNASLPERAPVPTHNPQYLAQGNETDTEILKDSDVWITFVSEGAGYKNALAYYTYPTANPPATAADIDTVNILFPNTSFSGSGGQLNSGDKVYLGEVKAGMSIGWILFANGWDNKQQSVKVTGTKYYSEPNFNPEPKASERQHNVMLYNSQRALVFIGFEDMSRKNGGSDNDFNDAIFYITANPIDALSTEDYPPAGSGAGNDRDGDGVGDNVDEYPDDPLRAFNQYFPHQGGSASLAYEDLWPNLGDYDFNDLVLDCQYQFVTNATNQMVDMHLNYFVRHIGAGFQNGFAVQMPFAPQAVSSVGGQQLTSNIVSLEANGVESNQSKAVIVAFDNAFTVKGDTVKISVNLSSPYSFSAFNQLGMNPFIFADGQRGREIHLAGRQATDLVDTTYYSQLDAKAYDNYLHRQGYPWGLELNNSFAIPTEKTPIYDAYLHFNDWVSSGGTQYADWYSSLTTGYRDFSKLY